MLVEDQFEARMKPQRVTDIKVGNEPLISDKTYTICVNNYRAEAVVIMTCSLKHL